MSLSADERVTDLWVSRTTALLDKGVRVCAGAARKEELQVPGVR